MAGLPTFKGFAEFILDKFGFSIVNIADSQTAQALATNVNSATSGSLAVTGFVAPLAGWIVGITVQTNENKTAGVLTFAPTIAGTALASGTGLSAVALANSAAKAYSWIGANVPGTQFAAGDLIGCKYTTDANLEPNTIDAFIEVFVIYKDVQP